MAVGSVNAVAFKASLYNLTVIIETQVRKSFLFHKSLKEQSIVQHAYSQNLKNVICCAPAVIDLCTNWASTGFDRAWKVNRRSGVAPCNQPNP